jgi:hypothetical protein
MEQKGSEYLVCQARGESAQHDSGPISSGVHLSTGLVVYYPCDQTSGSTLLDMSGHSPANNGTLLDTPSEDGDVVPGYNFAPGEVGSGSLVLTGSSYGYVSMPPNRSRLVDRRRPITRRAKSGGRSDESADRSRCRNSITSVLSLCDRRGPGFLGTRAARPPRSRTVCA